MFHVKQSDVSQRNIVRGICIVVGLFMTSLFLCNIGMHYEGLGSLTGVPVFGLLFLYGLFPDRFRDRWNHLSPVAQKILKAIAALLLCLALLTTGFMWLGIPDRVSGKTDTVIVLGSGVNSEGTPSLISNERADAALAFLESHPDSAVITSGGLYSNDRPKEAEALKNYLVDHGIAEDRICLERESTSTAENLRYSSELIEAEGLNRDVTVITSEFHAYRAALYAKRNGLNPASVSSGTVWWLFPSCWIREMYGILDAWLIHRR